MLRHSRHIRVTSYIGIDSPSSRVASILNVNIWMLSPMNLTEASANVTWTPPGWAENTPLFGPSLFPVPASNQISRYW